MAPRAAVFLLICVSVSDLRLTAPADHAEHLQAGQKCDIQAAWPVGDQEEERRTVPDTRGGCQASPGCREAALLPG